MILFAVLAVILIGSAVFTVTAVKPVYSVVGLLVNFVALAATYLSLQAEFLAVIQIVVYSGAILILFVFVIALLSSGTRPFDVGVDKAPRILIPALIFAIVALAGLTVAAVHTPAVIVQVPSTNGSAGDANAFGSVANFGIALFTTNLLPFEVTAFILMVAVIGVVLIAGDPSPGSGQVSGRRRKRPGAREPIVKDLALRLAQDDQG